MHFESHLLLSLLALAELVMLWRSQNFSLDSSSITVSANLSELDLLSEYGEYYTASKSVSESSVTTAIENDSSGISGADSSLKT